MEKKAFVGKAVSFATENKDGIANLSKMVSTGTSILGTMAAGGFMLNKLKRKIQNDTRRKALIEDLAKNDPIISQEDKEKVLEYYATIYNMAPDVSLDKTATRQVLQGFIRFGGVDVNTIKMLSETQRNISQSKDKGSALGSLF